MRRYGTYLAGIGYASIFGFSFLVTKGALEVLTPLELLFARFFVAALTMGALALVRVIKLDFRGGKPSILVLTCLFQPVIYFICETYGVRESATSTAGIVLGALPASVAVLGLLMLGERLRLSQAFGLALSVLGVAVIVLTRSGSEGTEGSLRGFLLLFASMASAAFFNVFSRKAARTFGAMERTFAMMWSGAVAFGILVLVQGMLPPGAGGGIADQRGFAARALSVWPAVLYLGLLSSVIAFFLINFTLGKLKASQSAVFANLVTVITVVAGVAFRGEPFGLAQAAGALMIVAGVYAANRIAAPGPAGGGRESAV